MFLLISNTLKHKDHQVCPTRFNFNHCRETWTDSHHLWVRSSSYLDRTRRIGQRELLCWSAARPQKEVSKSWGARERICWHCDNLEPARELGSDSGCCRWWLYLINNYVCFSFPTAHSGADSRQPQGNNSLGNPGNPDHMISDVVVDVDQRACKWRRVRCVLEF